MNNEINFTAARRWVESNFENGCNIGEWTGRDVLEFVEEHHIDGLRAFRNI